MVVCKCRQQSRFSTLAHVMRTLCACDVGGGEGVVWGRGQGVFRAPPRPALCQALISIRPGIPLFIHLSIFLKL